MEIHNNNISRASKENISIPKKSTSKTVESKKADVNSLNALASYGRAQVNSGSFKGKINSSEINVSKESRLNIINQLGITDKDEIKRLLNLTGFQFALTSSFLYIGLDIDSMEKELCEKIENFQEKENKDLARFVNKSKGFLIDNPQEVINFVKYMHEKNVSFDDKCSIATVLITVNEDSLSFAKELLNDESKRYGIEQISELIPAYTKETGNFVKKILNEPDDKLSKEDKVSVLRYLTPENVALAEKLQETENSKYNPLQIGKILQGTNKHTIEFVKEVLTDDTLNYNAQDLSKIIETFRKENLEIAQVLLYNPKSGYSVEDIIRILNGTTEENNSFAMDLICDTSKTRFEGKDIANILSRINTQKKTLDFVQNFIKQNNDYSNADKVKITTNLSLHDKTVDTVQRLINLNSEKSVSADTISALLSSLNYDDLQINFANYLIDLYENDEIDLDEYIKLIPKANKDNLDLIKKFINMPEEKRKSADLMLTIISKLPDITSGNLPFGKLPEPKINKTKLQFADYLVDMYKNNKINLEEYVNLISLINEKNIELTKNLIDPQQENPYSVKDIASIVSSVNNLLKNVWTTEENIDKVSFARLIIKNPIEFNISDICSTIENANAEQAVFIKYVLENHSDFFTNDDKKNIIKNCCPQSKDRDKISELNKLVDLVKQGELSKEILFTILNEENNISFEDVIQLKNIMGPKEVNALSQRDLVIAAHFKDICKVQNINEIPIYKKRNILRQLVANNKGVFDISENLRKYFPLLPKNQEEYCTLLPALVKSLGIESKALSSKDISDVKTEITTLSNSLKSMSDEDFTALEIKQEYSTAEFIKDTYDILKDLPPQECQKVYDYFGFELHGNKFGTQVDENEEHKYSITGYPVNLNNGKKLAEIKEPITKSAIEQLRPYVIRYSEENQVKSNNKEVEILLNNLLSKFPELRTEISKKQHGNETDEKEINNDEIERNKDKKIKGAHDYDLIKHSLKVMQKIAQNPEFEKLNDSDKNIMLLASLFHDITKPEGLTDKTHPNESAFDGYYILKKIKLSKEEEIKLYTLMRSHEWLAYVNNDNIKGTPQGEKRQQSVAFDLQYDNLFDMAKIFTIADLKAVKEDDGFYLKFKDDFDTHSAAIERYIAELKTSQPLLPITPIPKASRINKAITTVNEDGSTNIKGVYKDKNGLIIIKYNEVDNDTWEKIGFPKGSTSTGIETRCTYDDLGKLAEAEINTGNIKFFVHGLEYADQLAKFDAFALPDSDALLSVSYAERPESKYRFFRTQGVILTTQTKYTHGGGETDSGSGYSKNIDEFKTNYIFGGAREGDRKYISNMIKEALNMTDEKYIEFVKENADKPFTSIDPKVRDKIVKAFATINSNIRKGNRSYNEMYITNPEVMGVFAYPADDNVGEIMKFIEKQPDFLKQYAFNHDLPFIVFGN